MYYKDLIVAILQQAVDDYLWSNSINKGSAEKCPDERYYEFYYEKEPSKKRLKNKDIFKFKLDMFKDVEDFYMSDWGDICCATAIGWEYDGEQIYKQLLKRYGVNSKIKELYKNNRKDES